MLVREKAIRGEVQPRELHVHNSVVPFSAAEIRGRDCGLRCADCAGKQASKYVASDEKVGRAVGAAFRIAQDPVVDHRRTLDHCTEGAFRKAEVTKIRGRIRDPDDLFERTEVLDDRILEPSVLLANELREISPGVVARKLFVTLISMLLAEEF